MLIIFSCDHANISPLMSFWKNLIPNKVITFAVAIYLYNGYKKMFLSLESWHVYMCIVFMNNCIIFTFLSNCNMRLCARARAHTHTHTRVHHMHSNAYKVTRTLKCSTHLFQRSNTRWQSSRYRSCTSSCEAPLENMRLLTSTWGWSNVGDLTTPIQYSVCSALKLFSVDKIRMWTFTEI